MLYYNSWRCPYDYELLHKQRAPLDQDYKHLSKEFYKPFHINMELLSK